VGLLRAHLAAVAVVVAAVAATGGVFTAARPTYRPAAPPEAPTDVPYTHVTNRPAETQVALARRGISLIVRMQSPIATELSTADETVEVTVFGNPEDVERAGSVDYVLDTGRHWMRYPRTCAGGVSKAAVWHENVRAIVDCRTAGTPVLQRVSRALAALPRT
jgi:hypothetical protein